MTPEERVGQLFLVSFSGDKIDETSPISSLISKYHVGGVVLFNKNNNFSNQDNILAGTYQLTSSFQQLAFSISRDAPEADPAAPVYVPLFIGIAQEGDLYPNDQILSGMTGLPDLMAIGATWDTTLAEQVGHGDGRGAYHRWGLTSIWARPWMFSMCCISAVAKIWGCAHLAAIRIG